MNGGGCLLRLRIALRESFINVGVFLLRDQFVISSGESVGYLYSQDYWIKNLCFSDISDD